jgi:cobaltochelatase CobT
MRAIARDRVGEVPITSAAPNASAVQERVSRLPENTRSIDIAEVRGVADSIALKHRYHNSDLHRNLMPRGMLARHVFDAIEEARVEALGARNLLGVRANLAALAQKRALNSGLSKRRDNDANTVAAVLGLIVRERLTGDSPPDAARFAVESRREFLEQRVGHLIDSLTHVIENQKGLSLISLRIISELVGDDCSPAYEDQEPGEMIRAESEDIELPDVDIGDIDNITVVGDDSVIDEDDDPANDIVIDEIENDDAQPGEGNHEGTVPWLPDHALSQVPETTAYGAFTASYDAVSNAEELCDAKELESLRIYLDQQMVDLSGDISARHHEPSIPMLIQNGVGNRVQEYSRNASTRQLRLDARTAYFDHRDCSGYSRAHTGTMRRKGGDSGLHHECMERWPQFRGLGSCRQTGKTRPTQ